MRSDFQNPNTTSFHSKPLQISRFTFFFLQQTNRFIFPAWTFSSAPFRHPASPKGSLKKHFQPTVCALVGALSIHAWFLANQTNKQVEKIVNKPNIGAGHKSTNDSMFSVWGLSTVDYQQKK